MSSAIEPGDGGAPREADPAQKNKRGIPCSVFVACFVVAALLAAVLTASYHVRGARTLHIVNGLDGPFTARIDDGAPITVHPGERRETTLSAGKHVARVRYAGGDEAFIDCDMSNGEWPGGAEKAVFLLNPRGLAVVLCRDVVYSTNENMADDSPPEIYVGDEFSVIHDVDYAFTPAPRPEEFEVDEGKDREIRRETRLLERADPGMVFEGLFWNCSAGKAMAYAETRLRHMPFDESLLMMYLVVGESTNPRQIREFLEQGLSRRPVEVEWHRCFQYIEAMDGRLEQTARKYDDMLADEPDNAALCYLRARICPTVAEATEFLDRAAEADPNMPYRDSFLSGVALWRGDVDAAVEFADRAVEFGPELTTVRRAWYAAHMAAGHADRVAKAMAGDRDWALSPNGDYSETVAALTAAGMDDAANAWIRQKCLRESNDVEGAMWLEYVRRYTRGEEGVWEWADRIKSVSASPKYGFAKLVEQGATDDALAFLGEMADVNADPSFIGKEKLLLAAACIRDDRREAADALLNEAVGGLGAAYPTWAALFDSPDDVTMDEIDDVTVTPDDGALTLVLLAQRNESLREELLDRAELLNTAGEFPYRFLKRTIEEMRSDTTSPSASE